MSLPGTGLGRAPHTPLHAQQPLSPLPPTDGDCRTLADMEGDFWSGSSWGKAWQGVHSSHPKGQEKVFRQLGSGSTTGPAAPMGFPASSHCPEPKHLPRNALDFKRTPICLFFFTFRERIARKTKCENVLATQNELC